jgi:hypothetical protein
LGLRFRAVIVAIDAADINENTLAASWEEFFLK